MFTLSITDYCKNINVESDIKINFTEGVFVGLVSVFDKIKESIHGKEFSFSKENKESVTYDCHLYTDEDRKVDQKINFTENGVQFSVNTGNSFSSEEWNLLDSLSGLCAEMVLKFGVQKISCVWS